LPCHVKVGHVVQFHLHKLVLERCECDGVIVGHPVNHQAQHEGRQKQDTESEEGTGRFQAGCLVENGGGGGQGAGTNGSFVSKRQGSRANLYR
jgi:hypothetical protein